MKKIITVLMVLMVATSMFAKSVVLYFDNSFLVADTKTKFHDFSGKSDEEILTQILSCMPKETGGRKHIYRRYEIKDIDKYAKKYNNYMLVNYEQTYLIVGQNLDNKRMMCVEFLLEKLNK